MVDEAQGSHPVRVMARLDIKGRELVKGVNLEGLRVIGDPQEFVARYVEMGIDELVLFDVNASLYGFEHDWEYLSRISKDVNIPITAGGGVSSVHVFEKVLNAGADKVVANTAYTRDPSMINEVAAIFGSQAVVLYVESKLQAFGTFNDGTYRAYTENGRSRTDRIVEEWVVQAQERGCGEVILTSVEAEGRESGFDVEIISRVAERTRVPFVVSGGYGQPDHLDPLTEFQVDGIAIAAALHYGHSTICEVKEKLRSLDMTVR